MPTRMGSLSCGLSCYGLLTSVLVTWNGRKRRLHFLLHLVAVETAFATHDKNQHKDTVA